MPTLLCLWGDWHIGENISNLELDGSNEYSPAIASRRVKQLVRATKRHIQKLDPVRIYVLGLGDYISGQIHAELLENGTLGVMEQTELAGHLIGSAYTEIAESTTRPVSFYGLATDNHGRTEAKPRYKGRYKSNFSYLTLKYAKSLLPPKLQKSFAILKQISAIIRLQHANVLVTHGDQIKSYAGLPYYGIDRFYMREMTKCYRSRRELFDYLVLGHFHSPTVLNNNIIINGSLVGLSEFSSAKGFYSDPCQLLVLMDRDRLLQVIPLNLD